VTHFRPGIGSVRCERATSTRRIEGAESPLRVDVDGEEARPDTYVISDEKRERKMKDVSRAVTTFLPDEVERERDGGSTGPLSSKVPPHVPMLLLSEDGTIQDLTEGARRLLEYPPDASIEPLFFSHVHGQNLRRVMQDLAQMASGRKQRARWLLRLQTGNGRWRWSRARARRILGPSERTAHVLFRRL
jgi:PAS domain-containing protein